MSPNEHQWLNDVSHIYASEAGALNRDMTSYYSLRLTCRHIGPGRILQLGLGDGLIASELAKIAGVELDVIEGSSDVITNFGCKKSYQTIHTLFEAFVPDKPYDFVVANHILEHVGEPPAIISLAHSWTKPGGTAIFTVPHAHSLHRRIGVEMGLLKHVQELNAQDVELGHRRVYSLDEFHADLVAGGFNDPAISGYMLKIVSQRQMKGWSRELLDAIFEVSLDAPPGICSNIFALCKRQG